MLININILIIDSTYKRKYLIDVVNEQININGKIKKMENKKILELLRFFSTWEEEYISSNVLDGEEYFIEVKSDNKIKEYHGKGKYPNNYLDFKFFLKEL